MTIPSALYQQDIPDRPASNSSSSSSEHTAATRFSPVSSTSSSTCPASPIPSRSTLATDNVNVTPSSPTLTANNSSSLTDGSTDPHDTCPLPPAIQTLDRTHVIVHWDRGVDISSAGPHIMSVLRKIWGAERQLRAKRDTFSRRNQHQHTNQNTNCQQPHLGSNQGAGGGSSIVLLNQSLQETRRWEEILSRYERELDGFVFRRYQLRRVTEQAGKFAPKGQGRVYVKTKGYTLPEVIKKIDKKPKEEAGGKIVEKEGGISGDSYGEGNGGQPYEHEEKENPQENVKDMEEESEPVEQTTNSDPYKTTTCTLCELVEDLHPSDYETRESVLRLKSCGHEYCLNCLFKLYRKSVVSREGHGDDPTKDMMALPDCCDFGNFEVLLNYVGFKEIF